MNNLKSKHFRASILSFVQLNKIIANILNPIYRSPYNHQELEWVFCCHAQLRLHTISFFAIYTKTKDFRASELPCVPINSTIAVILNPILRYLRPSGAEISIYKFTRSRDHLNRENEILHHYLKLCHQLFWIQHHKIDQKTLRTAGALEMHTELSGLLE